MKHNFFRLAAVLLIVGLLLTMGFLKKPANTQHFAGKGFAVVELFTSEGCSSCPPADAEMEKIAKAYPANVFVLGFHVDYWDRLGWKDAFSSAAYSTRQRNYAGRFKLDGVYTPQAVVNGKTEMVGSDAALLTKTVDAAITAKVNQPIKLSVSGISGQQVQLQYSTSNEPGTIVNIALVQKATQTDVKGGENGGRVLHHINVVRDFKTAKPTAGSATQDLTLPAGAEAADYQVILFTQEQNNGEITAVAACPVQ